MKRLYGTLLGAGMSLSAGMAFADCAAEVARLSEGIAKDGSNAPLAETAPSPAEAAPPARATSPEGLQQDGTEAPLGASPDIATSGQDAASQSEGGDTAAAQATGAGVAPPDKAEALARARAALDAGDEQACMDAIGDIM
ncbi:MAG: hypothetical protein DI556_15200 [Rhodovulum sulfidophilum]|uniref:Uncharacterized protein n=1 Tax=Rhodovulum sulfidophilum TaxID=35806 RepID=A0A2W5N433_RHOSU|nr:MAG: hypothetical protein DI556_15200 [Rhodovulum sulfidophilum]